MLGKASSQQVSWPYFSSPHFLLIFCEKQIHFKGWCLIFLAGKWTSNSTRCGVGWCVCVRYSSIHDSVDSKYLDWFSKGLSKTAPWIVLMTSYFARLWQIWRAGVVLIQAGEPIHNHHCHEEREKIIGWPQSINLSTQVNLTPNRNPSSCHLPTLHPFADLSLPPFFLVTGYLDQSVPSPFSPLSTQLTHWSGCS